ncbi:MAG: hypothetical protein MJY79_06915 [Bacteroidaceae bacterium]|nr:hypothetical protein [Bacteroidaceae bacterium]
MRKFSLLSGLALMLCGGLSASAPKWLKTNHNAVCTVITYDADGNQCAQGQGVIIGTDGTVVSEYDLFRNAASAKTIDAQGTERQALRITGANSMYDVVKFTVAPDKKLRSLVAASGRAGIESPVSIMPYTKAKAGRLTATSLVRSQQIQDGYSYYTLSARMDSSLVGLPVVNQEGKLLAVIQKSDISDTTCYAIGADFLNALKITALSLNSADYQRLPMKKALPEEEEQAITYLYMTRGSEPEFYSQIIEDFIEQFPGSADGYMSRAQHIIAINDSVNFGKALTDIQTALKKTEKPAETHASYGNLIYSSLSAGIGTSIEEWTLDKALAETETAYSLDPQPAYLLQKGKIEFAMKNYQASFETYTKLNSTDLRSPENYFYTAMIKDQIGDDLDMVLALMDSAINFYGKPLTQQVSSYVIEKANIEERHAMYKEAVLDYNTYEEILGSGNLTADFYVFREQLEIKCRMYEQALADIEKAAVIAPDDASIYLELASMYVRVNYNEKAIPLLKSLIKVYPEDPDCHRLLGVAYMRTSQNDDACEELHLAKQYGDTIADTLIEQNCK